MKYMKITKHIYLILAMATLAVACSREDGMNVSPENQELCISATLPTESDWSVATRALPAGYSDCKLYYTNYKGDHVVYDVPDENISVVDGTINFKTDSDFVWQMVKRTEGVNPELYLSFMDNNQGVMVFGQQNPAYETHTVNFDNMTFSQAKLTLNLRFSHNLETAPRPEHFTAVVLAFAAGEQNEYDAWTHKNVWPRTAGRGNREVHFLTEIADDYKYSSSYSGWAVFPEQNFGETLTLRYDNGTDSRKWTVNLSNILVRDGKDDQTANQLYAGQHLVLNITAGMTLAEEADIRIEAFVKGEDKEMNGTAEAGYTWDRNTNTYTIYNMYGFDAWFNAYKTNLDTKLIAAFNTNVVDVKIPQSYLSDRPEIFQILKDGESYNLHCAGYQWKTIILTDEDSNPSGIISNVKDILTLNRNGISHAVISADIEDSVYDGENSPLTEAVKYIQKVFDNGLSSFYVTGDMKAFNYRSNTDYINQYLDNRYNGEYSKVLSINPMSTFGAALWIVYRQNTDRLNDCSIPNIQSLVLAEAEEIIKYAFFDNKIVNLQAFKVTSLAEAALGLSRVLESVRFDEVITGFHNDQTWHPFYQTTTSDVTLTLNEGQNASGLKPNGNQWAGLSWKEIILQ